jgi:hypothetical protein
MVALHLIGVAFTEQALNVIASSAKQSRGHEERLDCFVARAPRNDGVKFPPSSQRHCEPPGCAAAEGPTAEAEAGPTAITNQSLI